MRVPQRSDRSRKKRIQILPSPPLLSPQYEDQLLEDEAKSNRLIKLGEAEPIPGQSQLIKSMGTSVSRSGMTVVPRREPELPLWTDAPPVREGMPPLLRIGARALTRPSLTLTADPVELLDGRVDGELLEKVRTYMREGFRTLVAPILIQRAPPSLSL